MVGPRPYQREVRLALAVRRANRRAKLHAAASAAATCSAAARARSAASEGPADWAFPLHVDAAAKTLDRLNLAAVDRLMAPPERKAAVRAELRALGLLSPASEA